MAATSAGASYYLDMFVALRIVTLMTYISVAHVAVVTLTFGISL